MTKCLHKVLKKASRPKMAVAILILHCECDCDSDRSDRVPACRRARRTGISTIVSVHVHQHLHCSVLDCSAPTSLRAARCPNLTSQEGREREERERVEEHFGDQKLCKLCPRARAACTSSVYPFIVPRLDLRRDRPCPPRDGCLSVEGSLGLPNAISCTRTAFHRS